MRDIMIKLYVDDAERKMIDELAMKSNLSVNRYLREILCEKAIEDGYSVKDAKLFERVYTPRYNNFHYRDEGM